MGTKEKLLELLEKNKGTFFSGEEIAQKLAVSRTAVWKAANALRSAGYAIDAVQNRGYSLDIHTDVLTAEGIRRRLRYDLETQVLPCATSTNALLREQANAGAAEGFVLLANEQTKGRGRLGRDFYSPPDTGVYLSLLLRPEKMAPAQAVRITTMAAVAACRAIEEVTKRKPEIKWVNDIYIGGKKVCGILTEASMALETGSLEYVILGIGFNVYPPAGGFPEKIAEIADAILRNQEEEGKNRLAAAFLNHFMDIYQAEDTSEYAAEYRSRSFVIGNAIRVITPKGERNAYALDVDNECRLIVRYEDGSVEQLSSSEISVRT